ncbi:hypothetical protein C8R47DRAFT_357158 [Mycena vitilis]|nr:hypothetical protein C8R47DRAFT_357158 [Mycena vitilis]
MSQYNSNSPGGGGGFLSSQGSPTSTKTPASQSLRPVTIAQVRKATQMHSDADWVVDGNPIGQITVVAELFSHHAYTTNRAFVLDDGTGRIDAKMWIDTQDSSVDEAWRGMRTSSSKVDPLEPIYVRVTGSIKTHHNKRHIHASNIRVVKDQNEVYFHLLETISVHIIIQKGAPSRTGQEQTQSGTVPGQSAYAIQSRQPQAQKMFSPMADQVVHYLRTAPPNGEGIHVGDIAKALNANAMELSDTVDRLIDDGHVFTTIDDSHIQLAA